MSDRFIKKASCDWSVTGSGGGSCDGGQGGHCHVVLIDGGIRTSAEGRPALMI